MRKFLLKILVFSIIMASLLYALELCLFLVPNEVADKANYIEAHGTEINTLTLGNSQIMMGINPRMLNDSTFNSAYFVKSAYYNYCELRDALDKLSNLKCVIWNLSYNNHSFALHKFNSYRRDFDSTIRCRYYKYFDIKPTEGLPHDILWWETIWTSSEGPVMMRLFYGLGTERDFSKKGWIPYSLEERKPTWREKNAYANSIDYTCKDVVELRDFSINAAAKLAALCNERGIRLIVVSLPCHPISRASFCHDGLEEMSMCVDSMKAAYPSMEYYNYLYDDRFRDDDYYDLTHLNTAGAERFTEIFKREVFDLKK